MSHTLSLTDDELFVLIQYHAQVARRYIDERAYDEAEVHAERHEQMLAIIDRPEVLQ